MPSQNSRRRRIAAKQGGRKRPNAGTVMLTTALAADAPMAAFVAEANPADEALERALKVMDIARTALLQAQSGLEVIKRDSTDDTERAEAAVKLINVVRELELLEARRNSLVGGGATLRPPSPGAVDEAQERASRLAQVLASNGKVAAITGLVADIVRVTERLVA